MEEPGMAVPTTQTGDLQERIYRFIVVYQQDKGRPPTNREIGEAVGITSTSHIDYHLSLLEQKGLIARHPEVSRGIEITPPTRHSCAWMYCRGGATGNLCASKPFLLLRIISRSKRFAHLRQVR